MQLIGTKILGIIVQIKKNKGKCEILPLALHLARTGHIFIYIYIYIYKFIYDQHTCVMLHTKIDKYRKYLQIMLLPGYC